MKRTPSRYESEQGTILVFTAIAMVVLMGFLTFVVDYGILWVSRAQAQNAADAGALAGAIARAFDDPSNSPTLANGGRAYDSAKKTAEANDIWNASPVTQVTWTCPTGVVASCVRVDVFRGAPDRAGVTQGAALPLLFGGTLLNIATHGVRATATAMVGAGNTTNCMRPFGAADEWVNNRNPADQFDRWDKVAGNTVELDPRDVYIPPNDSSPGTGYTATGADNDIGDQVVLRTGNSITGGWHLPLRLPDGAGGYGSGADDYSDAIKRCIGTPVSIGQYLPLENGAMQGPTTQGVSSDGAGSRGGPSLINQDPGATWNTSTNSVQGSCVPACGPYSPRIVPIAVIDLDEYQWRATANNWTTPWIPGSGSTPGQPGSGAFSCPAGGRCVRVTNIVGFFVEGMQGNDVVGRVVMEPGLFVAGQPSVGSASSFLSVIKLIR